MNLDNNLEFSYWQVFTNQPFRGNSLPVIFAHKDLGRSTMKNIAREFRTTETVFIFESGRRYGPITNTKIRIFTPDEEIPFAGHPVLGAAAAYVDAYRDKNRKCRHPVYFDIELAKRFVRVHVAPSGNGYYCELLAPTVKLRNVSDPRRLLAALNVLQGQVGAATKVVYATIGIPFYLVNCRSSEIVTRMRPNKDKLNQYCRSSRPYPDCYCFAFDRKKNLVDVSARCFLASGGEDSGTGSAAVCVGHWLLDRGEVKPGDMIRVRQGPVGFRASTIDIKIVARHGEPVKLNLGGHALKTMCGTIVC
jgi:trans-2,3-dihydro-3-hydroxyanthranilate isomerase